MAVGWAQLHRSQGVASPGLGHSQSLLIASAIDGRIERVAVNLHDTVEEGATVVQMSPEFLRHERDVAAAEFLALTGAPLQDPEEQIERSRDLARSQQLKAEEAALAARIKSLRQLLEKGAASKSEVDQAVAKQREVRLQIARAEPDSLVEETTAWAVVAALRRLDEVESRLDALTVRSTFAGQVAMVHRHAGEVVRRGEPVLTVESPEAGEVIAWISASLSPVLGSAAVVQRSDGTKLSGEVVSLSAGTAVLPEQIWTIPGRPQYGRSVRVKLTDGTVRPREPVRVFL